MRAAHKVQRGRVNPFHTQITLGGLSIWLHSMDSDECGFVIFALLLNEFFHFHCRGHIYTHKREK